MAVLILSDEERTKLINEIVDSPENSLVAGQFATSSDQTIIDEWEKMAGRPYNALPTTTTDNYSNSNFNGGITPIDSIVADRFSDETARKLIGDSATAPTEKTAEEIAADERLEAQCMLIDFLPEFAQQNYAWRTDPQNTGTENNKANGGGGMSNPYMFGMWGDGDTFSSYVNGSSLKGKFLDFTTAQLSSLVPVMKFYKVNTNESGKTTDYLIPFPTHAGWTGGRSSQGNVVKNDNTTGFNQIIKDSDYHNTNVESINPNIISNVGIKSFDWKYQGTNPVSTKVDIKADLVLFAKNLSDILEPFVVYSIDGQKSKFRYVDFILRSGKIFKETKQYNPDYYRIKVQIGWKTENKELFTDKERECLEANTSTLFLTLTDHSFNFDQDGSFTLNMNYRAYFESLFASDDADFLRSKEQQDEIENIKQQLHDQKENIDAAAAEDAENQNSASTTKSDAQNAFDQQSKEYADKIDQWNKVSFERIIDSLSALNAIYYAQVDVGSYKIFKANPGKQFGRDGGINKILIFNPSQLSDIATAAKEAMVTDLNSEGNPNLNNFIPKTVGGKKNLSYFYLGDLLYVALHEVYNKIETTNKPVFLFGSALYKDRNNTSQLNYVNILDIPVSVEWFTEWFTSNIIAQDKTTFPILYFIRDLCSKLITNLLSGTCDKSGILKIKNKFNTLNFVLKEESFDQFTKQQWIRMGNSDIEVEALQPIIAETHLTINEPIDTSKTKEYVAIYCQDRTTPQKVDFCADLEKGRYHFYFGRDRGLVKKINFTREQTTGLRELNYVRDSTGIGLEQLMLPYNVEITMVGNNLIYNGMMIYIDPSGFGRKIGQPDDPDSVSYKLKLGGYHVVYGVQNHLGVDGYETKVQAKWVGSGRSSSISPTTGTDSGTIYGLGQPPIRANNPPIRTANLSSNINQVEQNTAAINAAPTAVAPPSAERVRPRTVGAVGLLPTLIDLLFKE